MALSFKTSSHLCLEPSSKGSFNCPISSPQRLKTWSSRPGSTNGPLWRLRMVSNFSPGLRRSQTLIHSSFVSGMMEDEGDEYFLEDEDDEELEEDELIVDDAEDEELDEDFMEEELNAEEAAMEAAALEEIDTATEDEEEEVDSEMPPAGCPEGFVLNFLWLENIVAISVDQTFSKDQRSPLTDYFIWPQTDAWEQLQTTLKTKPWISESDQICLLNRATEVINYWQEEGKKHALEDARETFPDCVFLGA